MPPESESPLELDASGAEGDHEAAGPEADEGGLGAEAGFEAAGLEEGEVASSAEAGAGASGDDHDDWGDEVPLFEVRKAALQKIQDEEDSKPWRKSGMPSGGLFGLPELGLARLDEATLEIMERRLQEMRNAVKARELELNSPEGVKRRQEAAKKRQDSLEYRRRADDLLQEFRKLPLETLVKSFLRKVPVGLSPVDPWFKALLGCGMAGLAAFPPASFLAGFPNTLLWHERLSDSGLTRYKVGLSLVLEYSRTALYHFESFGDPRGAEYNSYGSFADFVEAVLASAKKRDRAESQAPSQAKRMPEPVPRDLFKMLLELVKGMPTPERMAGILYCHVELPEKEIAKIMNSHLHDVQNIRCSFFDSINKRLDEYLSPYVTLHLSALERYQPLAGLLAKIRDFTLSLRTRR